MSSTGFGRARTPMKLGLSGINVGPFSSPEGVVKLAQGAEGAGLESVWSFEHLVVSTTASSRGPAPRTPFLDPLMSLAFAAAVTERVHLATGILVLPLHEPVALAKRVASLDVLSGGRVILGIGAGYYEPDFDAVGIPLAGRGARSDEYLAVMRALWSSGPVSHEGPLVSLHDVEADPRPIQGADLPVVVGGHAPLAYARAISQAHGWYGYALDVDQARICLQDLERTAGELSRPNSLGALEISVATPELPDNAMIEAYAELGVSRLTVPIPDEVGTGGLDAFFERMQVLRIFADAV